MVTRPSTHSSGVDGSLELFELEAEGLHLVADLEALESLQPDAALLAGDHLADVLLEVLERVDPALPDLLATAHQLDEVTARDLALLHPAAGDEPEARDLDRRDHLGAAFPDLPVRRLPHALGSALHVLGQLVDHVVVTHLDLLALRGAVRGRGVLEVEPEDDRVRDAGEQDVRLAHGAYALADDLDGDDRVLDLLQRGEHRLQRALGVRLDHQVELLDLAL